MEHEGSLPCSQEARAGTYPDPHEASLPLIFYMLAIRFNIILSSTLKIFQVAPSFRFYDQNIVCISHISHACYILLDLITLIQFREACKLWSSSLCSLLHSPVTSIQILHLSAQFSDPSIHRTDWDSKGKHCAYIMARYWTVIMQSAGGGCNITISSSWPLCAYVSRRDSLLTWQEK